MKLRFYIRDLLWLTGLLAAGISIFALGTQVGRSDLTKLRIAFWCGWAIIGLSTLWLLRGDGRQQS